jgi:aconitate hydratase
VSLTGLQGKLKPGMTVTAEIVSSAGARQTVALTSRIDTLDELDYYLNGGILQYVLRKLA